MVIKVKTDNIKKATPLFPTLMQDNAVELLKEDFNKLLEAKQKLADARHSLFLLEQEVETLKKFFDKEASIFDIEWEMVEKEVAISDNTQTGDVINRARERH